MKNYYVALLLSVIVPLMPIAAQGYSDFSGQLASKSIVLVNARGIISQDPDLNAIAITPNLLLATLNGTSGKLSIDGNSLSVVSTFKEEGLVLLSYPTGGLTPATLAKSLGEAERNVHVVRDAGKAVSGELLELSNEQPSLINMSMSKTLLSITGSGIFNNCGELIGIYDKSERGRLASALSLNSINTALEGVAGTTYSKTICPSEIAKRALDEEERELERQKVEAETEAKQAAADEAVKVALEKVAEQDKASREALAIAEQKSKKSIEEVKAALTLAETEALEKEALAEEVKVAAEAEKLANDEASEAVQAKKDERDKLLAMGAAVIALCLLIGIVIFLRRSKRRDELDEDEVSSDAEIAALLSFDILIRGEVVGIKVPAELVARARGVVIGRSATDCDFVIDSPELSRSHIRLSERDGILYVEDLGSANGTILNGLKLQPGNLVALHHEDELELAVTVFSIEFQER